jgi:mono/diheme cytochrome c family protein
MIRASYVVGLALLTLLAADAPLRAAAPETQAPGAAGSAMPADASGEEVYRQACATCHGLDGTGAPQQVVGFALPLENGHDIPDFTDCATNTVEPMADWAAVVERGGPIRALDRRMPAFGDALTADQIERALKHIWTFCEDRSWPRGDLNLPRPFFVEKAFPENETVWTTSVTGAGVMAVSHELVYERRIGSRTQYEIKLPIDAKQTAPGSAWSRGIGDVEVAVKHAFYANLDRGSIFAAGGAVILPTGKESQGLGNGFWVYEPFAMWGQFVGSTGFVQIHGGLEIPSDRSLGAREGFVRGAVGYTVSQDRGVGRAWTPMLEVLTARPEGGQVEWDIVPQMQVSLSRLQHVLLNVGVRVPLNERDERKPQVLVYLLWDWFDGGLFQFWK